jgi:predicted RNA-binding protein with PUA-like domain
MANRWLVKTDPALFDFEEFVARKHLTWEGVTQPASLGNLKRMRRGDDVLVHLTGRVRAIVGTARVRKGAYRDPRDEEGILAVVDLTAGSALVRPVPLLELREEPTCQGWEFLTFPRLTVMPVPAAAWRRVLALARR